MRVLRSTRFVLVIAAVLIGVSVWLASGLQRHTAEDSRDAQAAAQLLLTGMLDQETGMRGYLLTGNPEFLEPYRAGAREYTHAYDRLRTADRGSAFVAQLARADKASARWRAAAERAIEEARNGAIGARVSIARAKERKTLMDRFRAEQRRAAVVLDGDRSDKASAAGWWAVGVSVALVLLIAVLGDLLVGRRDREVRRRAEREDHYRATQAEFAETMQLVRGESDAHDVLKRHLERSIADAHAIVLNRNNSADRLEPTTRVEDAGLAERLEGATPDSCLAVRLGRTNTRAAGEEPLMSCDVCGATTGATTCRPLVVGSEVIGSVLVTHTQALEEEDRSRLTDSVLQAAPVLANLRNLAIAETRAATDALTGLPNRRAIEDTLKRMVAQSARTGRPMSALILDLDHFKSINDRFGHEHGDEALAAFGTLLAGSLRDSDFAGRLGGEEFVVFAPDTAVDGAQVLGENLRQAVRRLQVPGIDRQLSVSIGVASYPDVGPDGATLMRMADRALYSAKERGRDRVEAAARVQPGEPLFSASSEASGEPTGPA